MPLLRSYENQTNSPSYKHLAPAELKTGREDNPPEVMYKGKAEELLEPSNSLCQPPPHLNPNLPLR